MTTDNSMLYSCIPYVMYIWRVTLWVISPVDLTHRDGHGLRGSRQLTELPFVLHRTYVAEH